jgi:teichuronic acid biosynthesis protein TuaE
MYLRNNCWKGKNKTGKKGRTWNRSMLYIDEEKKDVSKLLLLLTVFTAFFGSTLSIKGIESLFAYRIFLALSVLLFCLSVLFAHRLSISRMLYRYYFFLMIWAVWAIVSFIWAQSKPDVIRGAFLLICNIFVIFFTSYYLNSEEDQRQLWRVFYAAFAINVAVALWEVFTTNHLPVSRMNEYVPPRSIPTAFYRNPNDFAAYIVMYLPLVYAGFKYEDRHAIARYILCIASVFVLLYTNSRSSYVAFLFTIAFACALAIIDIIKGSKYFDKKAKVKASIMFISIVMILILDSVGFGCLKNTPGNPSMMDQIGGIKEINEDGSTQVRINLIKNGFKILNEDPWQYIVGIGAGNTEMRMTPYADTTNGIVNMHNWWMEMLLEYGIIIGVLFIWFYLSLMWNLLKIYVSSPSHFYKLFAEGLFLSLVAFFMASISPSSIRGMASLWIIFGASMALIKLYKENIEEKCHESINTVSYVSK